MMTTKNELKRQRLKEEGFDLDLEIEEGDTLSTQQKKELLNQDWLSEYEIKQLIQYWKRHINPYTHQKERMRDKRRTERRNRRLREKISHGKEVLRNIKRLDEGLSGEMEFRGYKDGKYKYYSEELGVSIISQSDLKEIL